MPPCEQDAVVVQLVAHILGKTFQQFRHRHVRALFPAHVQHNAAVVHHQGAVAQGQGVVHIVGDHQAGDVVLRHDLLCQVQHLFGGGGVQSRGVFIQQQQFGGNEGCHQQRQRLALAAREQAHRLLHAIFQSQSQGGQLFGKQGPVRLGDAGEGRGMPGGPQERQGEVFLNGHVGRRPPERVLEHPPNDLGAAVVRHHRDVLAIQGDGTGIGDELPGDGIEQRGFARTVGAHDGGEIPFLQMEVHVLQRHLLVDGTGVEGLAHTLQIKHDGHLLSPPGHGGGGKPPGPAGQARQWPAPQ